MKTERTSEPWKGGGGGLGTTLRGDYAFLVSGGEGVGSGSGREVSWGEGTRDTLRR